MQTDKLQAQRFELKYLVPESTALAARDFIRSYLVPDDFSLGSADFSYPVHSLYYDSENLVFYQQTVNGDKNRYKLRARFYDDDPTSPVFLEIKRRTNNIISKQRCGVHRDALEGILQGNLPTEDLIISRSPKNFFALEKFVTLMMAHGARSRAHVAYRREAWVNPEDNSVRVTMDRAIRFAPQSSPSPTTVMQNPVSVFGNEVVLELKFTNRFPNWFRNFVRVFEITQCSAAKYAEGLTIFGEHRFRPAGDSSSAFRPLFSLLSATLFGEAL